MKQFVFKLVELVRMSGKATIPVASRAVAWAVTVVLAVATSAQQVEPSLEARLTRAVRSRDVPMVASLAAGKDVGPEVLTRVLTLLCGEPMAELPQGPESGVEIMRLLIEHGANPRAEDDPGNSCLTIAAKSRYHEALVYLLGLGASPGGPFLAAERERALAAALCSFEADDLFRWANAPPGSPYGRGQRPATVTTEHRLGRLRQTVGLLAAAGATGDRRDEKSGAIPLLRAAYWGEAGMVQAMLAAGADPDVQGEGNGNRVDKGVVTFGWTPLHVAALRNSRGNAEVVRVLLAAGADPKVTDARGMTAMDIARAKGHVLVAAALRAR